MTPYLIPERQARARSTFRSGQQGFCNSRGQELNQHCAGLELAMEGGGVIAGAGEDLKGPKDARKEPCPMDSLLLSLPPRPFGPVRFLWKKERKKMLVSVRLGWADYGWYTKNNQIHRVESSGWWWRESLLWLKALGSEWESLGFFLICNIGLFRQPRINAFACYYHRVPKSCKT